jgi:Phosphate transport (Pho88)
MNSPLQSLAISLAVMQGTCLSSTFHFSLSPLHTCHVTVARKVPFDDPQVLEYVRIGYIASQAIALVAYYYASSKVCINPHFLQLIHTSHVSDQSKERPDDAQIRCTSLLCAISISDTRSAFF